MGHIGIRWHPSGYPDVNRNFKGGALITTLAIGIMNSSMFENAGTEVVAFTDAMSITGASIRANRGNGMTLIRATTVIEASEICEEEELHRLARPFAPDTRLGTPAQMMTYAHWDYYPQTPNCRNPLARADTDVLALDDDVGMPGTMMLSPATRRTFFKSRLGEIIQAARAIKPDLHILFHSDGYFEPIIGDLIEIGVNAINPLQPDHMDAIRIRQRFGPRLAFWGTVGRQTTFSFATPDDIRQEVQYRIETLGCAGLILCSAYDIDEPDIPWENIAAFLEAVEAYG